MKPKFKSKIEETTYERSRAYLSEDTTIQYEVDRLAYYTPSYYVPDFTLTFPCGTKRYIEVKGYLRPGDRTKLVSVKKSNPELDIRILFQRDQRLSKRHKMYYSDWAEKYGFPYAFEKIPREWLKL